MVKCAKTPFDGEGLAKILWRFPCMTVLWKLLNIWGVFGAC